MKLKINIKINWRTFKKKETNFLRIKTKNNNNSSKKYKEICKNQMIIRFYFKLGNHEIIK